MKTTNSDNLEEENLKIPFDMAPDIFEIIVSQQLPHEITNANSGRCYFTMTIQFDKSDTRQKKAVSDIQSILDRYYEYRNASNDELNWR
jgi:hypothetical protein